MESSRNLKVTASALACKLAVFVAFAFAVYHFCRFQHHVVRHTISNSLWLFVCDLATRKLRMHGTIIIQEQKMTSSKPIDHAKQTGGPRRQTQPTVLSLRWTDDGNGTTNRVKDGANSISSRNDHMTCAEASVSHKYGSEGNVR